MFYVLIKTVKIFVKLLIWNLFIFRFNKHFWKDIYLSAACVKVSFLLLWWGLILIDPAHLMLQGTWNRKPSLNVFSEPGQSTQRGPSNRAHFFTQRFENVRDREKMYILLHIINFCVITSHEEKLFWLIFISSFLIFQSFSQRCTSIFASTLHLSLLACSFFATVHLSLPLCLSSAGKDM